MRFHFPHLRDPRYDPFILEEAGWILFFLCAILAMLLWPGLRG